MGGLIEVLFSVVVVALSMGCVLPFLGVIGGLEIRMDEAVVVSAVDRSQVISRYIPGSHVLQKAVAPEGLWIDRSKVVPMKYLEFLSLEKELRFNNGFCTLGGTVRVGGKVLVVLPVTGLVKED
ncbi:MAG: hypothetical protein PWP37_220 [Thermotogota bacterium]|nr:hypothetical protein [Thermotogota bacterium]MDK2864028.1 hypothetical protein [Thermotogota bacterium]